MYPNKEGYAYHFVWRIGTANLELVRVIERILERVEVDSALCGSENGTLDGWDFWLSDLYEPTALVKSDSLIEL
jgi:hypothetical protein